MTSNNYVVLICVRNEELKIMDTVVSILNQTIIPKHLVIVDDGSTDTTPKILHRIKHNVAYGTLGDIVTVITRSDRGFSALGSYLMADTYNSGLKSINRQKDWDYLLIIGADMLLPKKYVERLIKFMGDEYAIASGKSVYTRLRADTTEGGGRLIKKSVIDSMGGLFLRTYDWESTPLRYARYRGWKVGLAPDIKFIEGKPRTKYKMVYLNWGRGMKDSFYHPLVVIGRIIRSIVLEHNINKGIQLLVGYISEPTPKESLHLQWLKFTREIQKKRIVATLQTVVRYLP